MRFFTLCLLFLVIYKTEAKRYITATDSQVIEIIKSKTQNHDLKNIKILVWNVYKGNRKAWGRDYLKISKNKDFTILQEVVGSSSMLEVFKKSKLNYVLAYSFKNNKNKYFTGVAIASKHKAESYKWERSFYREPFIHTPKMILSCLYNLDGNKKLMIIDIHAINFVTTYKFKNMIQQVQKMAINHKGPLIIAGDFNTWSKSRLLVVKKMARNLSLRSVKFKNDYRKTFIGNALDHIFYRGADVNSSRVIRDINSSDHKALEVSFNFSDY